MAKGDLKDVLPEKGVERMFDIMLVSAGRKGSDGAFDESLCANHEAQQ